MSKMKIGKKASPAKKLIRRWSEFEYIIKNKWRFTALRQTSNKKFKSTYEDLLKTISKYDQYYTNKLDKGFAIYRGRDGKRKSFKQFYPPPKKSTKNQRLSPIGIPLFYGALDRKTCIAELRPSIEDIVSVCHFITNKKLVVLDFTKKRTVKTNITKCFYNFSEEFAKKIAKPIGIESSDIDYIPTQAFTEFFRSEEKYAGIIYPSAQRKGGKNIVLFSMKFLTQKDIFYYKIKHIRYLLTDSEDGNGINRLT